MLPGLCGHNKSSNEGVKYPCPKCNYKTSFEKDNKKHIAIVHEGLHPFHCNQCEYKAGQKLNLLTNPYDVM